MNEIRLAATTIEVGATALWVGSSFGYACVAAPIAYAMMDDRAIQLVYTERSLARLAQLSYIAGGSAVAIAVWRMLVEIDGRKNDALRSAAGAIALACIAYHERKIVPAMTHPQRAAAGTYHTLAEEDLHRRLADRSVHRQSKRIFAIALAFGALQLMLAATRPSAEHRPQRDA